MDMHINMHADTEKTELEATTRLRAAALAASMDREKAALRRRHLTVITILFVAAGLVAAFTVNAKGQGVTYKSMKWYPQFDDASTIRQMETASKELARAKALSDVRNLRYAQIYFANYLPAKFTQPDALPEISKLMQDAMKTLSSAQRTNNPGAKEMIRLLFPGMKNVAEGDYHPAARIAAISIISRLDSRPGSTTAKRAPVPLAASFPVLLAQYLQESNPDGVRAAALQGLHRYVSIGFPALRPQDGAQVVAAMQKLLDADPPSGRDRVAHAYMQRFAVDILATLKPADEKLGETLVSVSTEPRRHDLIALYSVSKLASIGKYGNVAENVEPVVSQWTARAMKAFQYEYERLELMDGIGQASSQPPKPEATVVKREDQPRFIPGSYDDESYEEEDTYDESYEDESYDMEDESDYDDEFGYVYEANPQPPEVVASRRRLNHVLQQIHRGVTGSTKAGVPPRPGGLLAIAKDDQKRKIEKWAEEMKELVEELNNRIHDDRSKFKAALLLQVETIKEIAGAAGEEVAAEYANLPLGLNPLARLAVLSGASLEEAKDAERVVVPDVQPVAPAGQQPPAEAAKPPVDAAASTPAPAPAGS